MNDKEVIRNMLKGAEYVTEQESARKLADLMSEMVKQFMQNGFEYDDSVNMAISTLAVIIHGGKE